MILYGSAYWQGLLDWIRTTMLAEGKISPADMDLLMVIDSPAEIRDTIVRSMQGEPWREQQEEGAREATRKALGRR